MSGFSFSSCGGYRLCKIDGGKFNNKVIYLYDKKYLCCPNCNKKCEGNCCDSCSIYTYHKNPPEVEIDYIKIEDDGVFQQMPSNIKKQRSAFNIVGKAGSGKSVYLSKICKEYKRLYPLQKIFLFSMKKEDENLDPYISKRVNLDEYVEKGGLTEADFENDVFCIFDDIDQLENTKPDFLRNRIFSLMNQLIQISRSKNITIAQTSHTCLAGSETKHILNGMTSFTFFTHAISAQIRKALEIYVGLTRQQVKHILEIKDTRYITICMTSPMVVMTEKELFILK